MGYGSLPVTELVDNDSQTRKDARRGSDGETGTRTRIGTSCTGGSNYYKGDRRNTDRGSQRLSSISRFSSIWSRSSPIHRRFKSMHCRSGASKSRDRGQVKYGNRSCGGISFFNSKGKANESIDGIRIRDIS